MVRVVRFLLFSMLVLDGNAVIAQPVVPNTQTAGPELDDALRSFLSSQQNVVTETISDKKSDKLDAQLQAMQIPNFQDWFVTTFGADNGAKMSAIYSETLTKWESRLKESFTSNAEPGGQVTAGDVYGGLQAQSLPIAQQIDKAIRESLKRPTTFQLVQYTGKSAKSGYPYGISIGYATLVNGSYRVVPENVMRALPNMPAMRIRQGGAVAAKSLMSRVQPVYPADARNQRVSGTVRLHAIIGRDGAIRQLEVLSGDPSLVQAALDAVRQWRYRPTTLNGEAVEVDTVIDIIFSLSN